MDAYILNRLRTGVDSGGHESCDRHEMRFHVLMCPLYAKSRPMRSTLFDDSKVGDWLDWAGENHNLHMGIPKSHPAVDDAMIVGGNPFERMIWIRKGDEFSKIPMVGSIGERCRTFLPHKAGRCLRPVVALPSKYEFVAEQRECCWGCGKPAKAYQKHLERSKGGVDKWRLAFYSDIWKRWDAVDKGLLEALVIWRGINDAKSGERFLCRCGNWYPSKSKMNSHVSSVAGDDCFCVYWDEFVLWMREFFGGD